MTEILSVLFLKTAITNILVAGSGQGRERSATLLRPVLWHT